MVEPAETGSCAAQRPHRCVPTTTVIDAVDRLHTVAESAALLQAAVRTIANGNAHRRAIEGADRLMDTILEEIEAVATLLTPEPRL